VDPPCRCARRPLNAALADRARTASPAASGSIAVEERGPREHGDARADSENKEAVHNRHL
jgi:hypothetical protein